MTGLLGSSALQIALAISVLGAVTLSYGARARRPTVVQTGFAAVYAAFGMVAIATIAMLVALVSHDFSVSYVAQVGSRSTPLFFTVISLWGALEGSILFWAFLLFGFAALAVHLHRGDRSRTLPFAAATLLVIGVFFLVLLVGPANPFGVVSPVPQDGPGPNPLLQNHPLMAVHPPFLYLGYVGFAVPFAFAVGAMVSGEVREDKWIRHTRLWTIAAWVCLTWAIIAGMWWSYEVLGWGGYWAWDPVENASLMPWLTATAFLHSIMIQQRRTMLRVWNLNLVVATFVLTVLGTFLTRSGILSSVHAFTQGTIGYYFLGFIALTLIVSLALVAGTATDIRSKGRLDSIASRETAFLAVNLLFSVLTFTVLLGTLFPLVAEATRGVKVSVGAPFFNRMTLPAIVAMLFLLGVGPALPWRRGTVADLKWKLRTPLIAFAVVLVGAIVAGARDPYALLAFAFAGFAAVTNVQELWLGTGARVRAHGETVFVALRRLIASNPHRYGGYLAHLGVLAAAAGVAASSAFKTEREVTLTKGQTISVAGVVVRLDEVWGRQESQRFSVGADLSIVRGGSVQGHLEPRQHFYPSSEQPIPTPAVNSGPRRDVYVNLMAFANDGSSATIRVLVEPMVSWIWVGGAVICLGALIGLWPSRKRNAEPIAQAKPVATPPVRRRKHRRLPVEVAS
jgi:cytochrome c-type biogenesis protein CcmF